MTIFKIQLIKKHQPCWPTTFHMNLPKESIEVRGDKLLVNQKYLAEHLLPYLGLAHDLSKYQEIILSSRTGDVLAVLGTDAGKTDFSFAGPVNQAIKVFGDAL